MHESILQFGQDQLLLNIEVTSSRDQSILPKPPVFQLCGSPFPSSPPSPFSVNISSTVGYVHTAVTVMPETY